MVGVVELSANEASIAIAVEDADFYIARIGKLLIVMQ
jgi:hypothetical protein